MSVDTAVTAAVVWCNHCNYLSAVPYFGNGHAQEYARREASRGIELHCVLKHPDSDEALVALMRQA